MLAFMKTICLMSVLILKKSLGVLSSIVITGLGAKSSFVTRMNTIALLQSIISGLEI